MLAAWTTAVRAAPDQVQTGPARAWLRPFYRMYERWLARQVAAAARPRHIGIILDGTLVHTDEYVIYARLPAWGYQHKTVCHGSGEYARDEDGDGFCEVHVNTMEEF